MMKKLVNHMNLNWTLSVAIGLFLVTLAPQSVSAGTLGGNDIQVRTTRDGVGGNTYVDMTHTVLFDSIVSGWNIWAQSYAASWPANTAPRSIKLIILRSIGSNLSVVGKSELETVT